MAKQTYRLYWVLTGVVAVAFLASGAVDAVALPPAVALLTHLGYPAYFSSIIGVWKILGAFVIVVPRAPRLKEWAYAGIAFDLTGAAMSHAMTGDGADKIVVPVVLLGVAIGSWRLRPASRTLGESAR